jgi:hypothetical protein
VLSFSPDEYTRSLELDRGEAVWRARLSDGRIVHMDDARPGTDPASAWLRLRDFIHNTDFIEITDFWLEFRGHAVKPLPLNAEGYFFCKSSSAELNGGATHHFMLIGALQSGRLLVQRWSVPELIHMGTEERNPKEAGQRLILND